MFDVLVGKKKPWCTTQKNLSYRYIMLKLKIKNKQAFETKLTDILDFASRLHFIAKSDQYYVIFSCCLWHFQVDCQR
jgi:hypothetical protein